MRSKTKCKNRSGRTLFEKVNEDGVEISLIATERKDYLYLNEIIGNDRILYDKKVLLVGGDHWEVMWRPNW